jgi:hypothetical protein
MTSIYCSTALLCFTLSVCSVLINYANQLGVCFRFVYNNRPIPVGARFKALVCSRLVAGVVSSNPAGGMDVPLVRMLCVAW